MTDSARAAEPAVDVFDDRPFERGERLIWTAPKDRHDGKECEVVTPERSGYCNVLFDDGSRRYVGTDELNRIPAARAAEREGPTPELDEALLKQWAVEAMVGDSPHVKRRQATVLKLFEDRDDLSDRLKKMGELVDELNETLLEERALYADNTKIYEETVKSWHDEVVRLEAESERLRAEVAAARETIGAIQRVLDDESMIDSGVLCDDIQLILDKAARSPSTPDTPDGRPETPPPETDTTR